MKKVILEKNKIVLEFSSKKANNGEVFRVEVTSAYKRNYKNEIKYFAGFANTFKAKINGKYFYKDSMEINKEQFEELSIFIAKMKEKEKEKILKENKDFINIVDDFFSSKEYQECRINMHKYGSNGEKDESKFNEWFWKKEDLFKDRVLSKIINTPIKYINDVNFRSILVKNYLIKKHGVELSGIVMWFDLEPHHIENTIKDNSISKEYTVKKIIEKQMPIGGENGVDGYIDVILVDLQGEETRIIYRDVFDFGAYGYPKRVEGTDDVFHQENWTKKELEGVRYVQINLAEKFGLRM